MLDPEVLSDHGMFVFLCALMEVRGGFGTNRMLGWFIRGGFSSVTLR